MERSFFFILFIFSGTFVETTGHLPKEFSFYNDERDKRYREQKPEKRVTPLRQLEDYKAQKIQQVNKQEEQSDDESNDHKNIGQNKNEHMSWWDSLKSILRL